MCGGGGGVSCLICMCGGGECYMLDVFVVVVVVVGSVMLDVCGCVRTRTLVWCGVHHA